MRGILIFDHLNDVLFTKCDRHFAEHIQKLAVAQGLLGENKDENEAESFKPNPNIIMQLFSPLITSQCVMASQFGNTYKVMKCLDGTNTVFDEYMGYTFVYVSHEDTDLMKRTLGVCIAIVKHLCGPDVSLLKSSRQKVQLVSHLMDAWHCLRKTEQNILTESVEQLSVNPELGSAILKVLSDAIDKLKTQAEFANIHLLVLVQHKFLSLFSSPKAQDLLGSDILLMILLCYVADKEKNGEYDIMVKDTKEDCILITRSSAVNKEDEYVVSGNDRKLSNPTSEDISILFEGSRHSSICESLCLFALEGLYSQVMILGSEECGYTANAVHVYEIADDIHLVTIIEMTNMSISFGLYNSFYHLNVMNGLQMQRDFEDLRPALDHLDASIKKTFDGIKKNRGCIRNEVEIFQRRLQVKWDFIKKKYLEIIKSRDPDAILQIEANQTAFTDALRDLFRLTCLDKNFLKLGTDMITTVSRLVSQKLNDISDFIKVKALKNVDAASYPFYRTTHRQTAPMIDFTNNEILSLTKKKIWSMVEQSRVHLQEGHMTVMWKDTTFNYSYFLWFEDDSGTPLKCKTIFNHVTKNLPPPGIICGDYYRKLANIYFPKLSANKVRVYELYCVHLGLVTSSCVLEHSRRLAATIWEVTGLANNPADLL
ncbi:hypothetical protein TKK_0014119 [Trichogramma kaykai]|uniref:Hermansky-Pudlak syndrome 1 protein homolog n=1 Tax=Trichogramma kaykai TaxID=54128 RepID=A0ABD2WEN0_9HYME